MSDESALKTTSKGTRAVSSFLSSVPSQVPSPTSGDAPGQAGRIVLAPPGIPTEPETPAYKPPEPAAPATPPPTEPDVTEADKKRKDERKRAARGRASTILTGGRGLLDEPVTARRTLLGA